MIETSPSLSLKYCGKLLWGLFNIPQKKLWVSAQATVISPWVSCLLLCLGFQIWGFFF